VPHLGCPFDRVTGLRLVGDPVDVVTGAVVDQVRDFAVDGREPLRWGRFYSSRQAGVDRSVGRGWTHSWDHQLRIDLDGVAYVAPIGTTIKFPFLDGENRRAAKRGYVLVRTGDVYHLSRPDGPPLLFRRTTGARIRATAMGVPGRLTTFEYDADGRLAGLLDPDGNAVVLVWDDRRLMGARVRPKLGGAPVEVVRYHYDPAGLLIAVDDAYRHQQRYDYDAAGRMARRIDRRGYSFLYHYDADGRCIHSAGEDGLLEVSLQYFPVEGRTLVTKADGGVWQYEYEPASGTLTTILDPLGATRTFVARPEDGQIGVEIDGAGNELRHVYDPTGKPLGVQDSEGRWVLPPRPHRTPRTPLEYELGTLDPRPFALPWPNVPLPGVAPHVATRLQAAVDTSRGQTTRVRDVQGLLLREECDGRTRRYAYDANGGLRWWMDFDGAKSEIEVSSLNQRVAIKDPNGLVTRLEHTREDELAAAVDPRGSRCDFKRDARQSITTVARAAAAKDLYVRDGASRLVEKRDANGRALYTLERGPQGEVLARRFASGASEELAYDDDMRVVAGETAAGAIELAYVAGKRVRDVRDGRGVERRFVGDDIVDMRVLDRFVTRYRYTDSHSGRGEREVAITDPTGRTHKVRSFGQGIYERAFAGGARETAQFHPSGRCLRKIAERPGESDVWERRYAYSGEGDLLASEDSARGLTRYAYDAGHRLIAEHAPGEPARAFQHDDAGNLLQNGAGYATYLYGNVLAEANGRRFEHDARQAVVIESWEGGSRRFFRDERDQLVRVEQYARTAGGAWATVATWSAKYDALGRRTEKTGGDQTTTFYWDTDRLAAEVRPDGALRVYVYADALAMTPFLFVDYASADADPKSGKVYFVFANHLGCPEAVLDVDGNWVWAARIEPYGRAHVLVGHGFHQPLRWPGHYDDEELALHYNRFRYYSPDIGRYLEPDPLGRGGRMENVYAYTRGNPLAQVDLRGLNGCSNGGPPEEENENQQETQGDEEDDGRYQTLAEREAEGGTIPDYAEKEPEKYAYDTESNRYVRIDDSGPSRETEFPSGYRQGTHDEMAARWTDQGREQGGVPVDANGERIPPDQLVWRDEEGNRIANKDLTYDHQVSCAEMYNNGATVTDPNTGETTTYPPGSNTDRATRNDFYNDPNNMVPMTRSDNSSKGSDYRYGDAEQGPDYEH
jgi:RHS repeat-associated protein